MSTENTPELEGDDDPDRGVPVKSPESGHAPAAKPATEEQLRNVQKEMNAYERSTLKWTRMIAGLYAVTAIFICLQWNEMRTTSVDTHDLATAADKQADAAKALAYQAKAQTDKMDSAIAEATKQAKATNSLSEEAGRSAKAAEDSLAEVRADFYRDQRPWVFVEKCELSGELEENKSVSVFCHLVNIGKSPAIDMIPASRMVIAKAEVPIAVEITKVTKSRGVLPPSTTTAGGTHAFSTDSWTPPREGVTAYAENRARLYLQVRVSYLDTYGRSHWTIFHAWHARGKPLIEWTACEFGNDVDRDPQPAKQP